MVDPFSLACVLIKRYSKLHGFTNIFRNFFFVVFPLLNRYHQLTHFLLSQFLQIIATAFT